MVPTLQSHTFQTVSRRNPGAAKPSIFSSRIVGFVILAVLALLYLAQANQASTKTIDLQSSRQQADELQTQINQVQLDVDRANSDYIVSTQASPSNLVPVDKIEDK